MLSPDEISKSARFRSPEHRRTFVTAHAALRMLLASYLAIPAESIRLETEQRGKPVLAFPSRLKFNMSHGNDAGLFAFSLDCDIGVDLERLGSMENVEEIADRFFCPEEASELLSLPPGERETAFLWCWTRKEAYVKALGEGLYEPFDAFRVSVLRDAPERLIHIRQSATAAQDWSLHDIDAIPGYAGALAYKDLPRPVLVRPLISATELLSAHC